MDFMNKKYVDYLEEIVILEAEIVNNENNDYINKTLLFYINLVKNIIVNELGIIEKIVLDTDTTYETIESRTLEIYS